MIRSNTYKDLTVRKCKARFPQNVFTNPIYLIYIYIYIYICIYKEDLALNNLQGLICHKKGGARGVMVIVVGNGHADTSSNPGRD